MTITTLAQLIRELEAAGLPRGAAYECEDVATGRTLIAIRFYDLPAEGQNKKLDALCARHLDDVSDKGITLAVKG